MPDAYSAGAGIVGSILNYISNEHTNRANIQMQDAANQANRDIAQEQNQWNLMMWQKQNAYNDPSAQMSRLRAAGINPALAYANGGLMNEAAPAQEAAGATMQAAQIKPYYNDPLMLAQIANLNADTHEKESRVPVNRARVNEINENANKVREEARAVGISNAILEQTMPSQVEAAIAKNKFDKASAEAAMQYVNDTARVTFEQLEAQLDNLKKDGKIKDKVYDQKVAELRSLNARAEIDEYERDNKDVGFWLGKVDSLWDLIALGVLKYKELLDYIPDGSQIQHAMRDGMAIPAPQ